MTLPASGPLTFSDIQTEFGGSNPIAMNEYYAGGTYVAAGTSGTYGAVPSSGQISVQNFYGTSAIIPIYIEEVFNTYLYTGTGASLTITNGIDLSTKGGLVWQKDRPSGGTGHYLQDTVRGVQKYLLSNTTDAEVTNANTITAFNSTGYTVGGNGNINGSGEAIVSWTFREQPKFFDVVTYTGNGSTQNIAHNLGSEPGCIIVKKTSSTGSWYVYHRSLGDTAYINLNLTDAAATGQYSYFYGGPSSTTFTVNAASGVNESGQTFVAYLFAHNAGGFGLTGTDNVISCGSFTMASGYSPTTVTLGYEPQWVMMKSSTSTSAGFNGGWSIMDNMRGLTNSYNMSTIPDPILQANTSAAENNGYGYIDPTATGFITSPAGSSDFNQTFIYIAIRRGPMKVPTDATKVFIPIAATNASGTINTTNFPVDMQILTSPLGDNRSVVDRLRSVSTNSTAVAYSLKTEDSVSENTVNLRSLAWSSASFQTIAYYNNYSALYFNFRRAPSFFDEVCYTGVGGTASFSHNLGVAPELMFVKCRSVGNGGLVYNKTITASKYLQLFFDGEGNRPASNDTGGFAGVEPTSSVFTVGFYSNVNTSGATYVAYLFATCAGVSKVGSYTGNGSTQTIDCGLTAGARFVLIKRTDATGGWYTYDTARGMTTLTDPYLLLNTQGAQVATLGSVTTVATGFALNAAVLADINVSAGSYIFLAIA